MSLSDRNSARQTGHHVVKKYSTTGLLCSRRDASVTGSASEKVRVNSGARCPTLLPTSGDVGPSDTGPLVGVGLPLALSVGVDDNAGAPCPTLLSASGDVEPSDAGPLVGVGVGAGLPLALAAGVEDNPGGDSVFPPHDAAANNRSASAAGHKRALAWPVLLERNSNFMGWCG